MRVHRCRRMLGSAVLTLGLAAGSGCLSFIHPLAKPDAELIDVCHTCPQPCRNHVYVFLMNGIDPTNCCNLTGLGNGLQSLGFMKTYYGCPLHSYWFTCEIRRIHKEDPDARFALVGYGVGGNVIDAIAWDARKEWIPIDLVVYLDCNTLDDSPAQRPDNVARVINIWSGGNLLRQSHLPDAENMLLLEAGPFGSPSNLATVETLAQELMMMACRVPIDAPEDPAPAVPPESAPTPRPVMPQVSKRRDDWDFLKPVDRYDHWPVLTGRRKGESTPEPERKRATGEKVTVNGSTPHSTSND